MKDTVRIFLVVAIAAVVIYFCLHVLRSFNVAPEARGIGAGALGCLAGSFVVSATASRRRKR